MRSFLTPQPYRSGVAVFVNNSVLLPGCVGDIIDHPDGGEDEQDDEEDLQVRHVDVNLVVSAAADQSAAQDQEVDAEDPGQHPSPVAGPLPHHCVSIWVGLTGVLRLTRSTGAVGQMSLLRLLVFARHPAGLTRIAIGQTLAGKDVIHTHIFLLCPPATEAASGYKRGCSTPFINFFPGLAPPK